MIMMKPENIRPNMEEQRLDDQTAWVSETYEHTPIALLLLLTLLQRIEPYGWDRKDREYYALDDNRLYRLSAAPITAAAPKKNSQKAKAAARAAKRRRVAAAAAQDSTNEYADDASVSDNNEAAAKDVEDENPLGSATWECVAITLEDFRTFIEPLKKSKDANEKILLDQIEEHMLPLLEKQEESRKRKMLQRERELLSLEKMATAKRSSRIAGRDEQRKQEETERQEREKRLAEEAAARKEEQQRRKIEKERDNRLMSRERRLREREARRIQHEEELAQLSEGSKSQDAGRLSERRLKAEIEKNRQALKELEEEEYDSWTFDCVCGLHGQVDDGEHSVACERCSVWQHSKCLGIEQDEADRDDFHFICDHCKRAEKEKAEKRQKQPTKIKIKLKEPGSATSTPSEKPVSTTPIPLPKIPGMSSSLFADNKSKPKLPSVPSQLNGVSLPSSSASTAAKQPELSPQKHSSPPTETRNAAMPSISSGPIPSLQAMPQRKLSLNGQARNPFSSPHPNLLPPDQSPNKSRAYGSIYNSSSPITRDEIEDDHNLAGRSSLANPGGHESPTKEPATKNTPAVASPQKTAYTPISAAKVLDHPRSSPSSMATPRLSPSRPEDSDPLPSARGGISPTKNSPTLPRSASSFSLGEGQPSLRSSPVPAILPPVPTLSPTPTKTDLTPPVKVDEPPRPVSHQSSQLQSSPMQPRL